MYMQTTSQNQELWGEINLEIIYFESMSSNKNLTIFIFKFLNKILSLKIFKNYFLGLFLKIL